MFLLPGKDRKASGNNCWSLLSFWSQKKEQKNLFIQSGENPSNDRLDKLIKTYDSNGNGKIEFKEFLKMYNDYRTNPDIDNKSSIKSQPSTNKIQNNNNNDIKYSHAFLEVCNSQLDKYPDLKQVDILFCL